MYRDTAECVFISILGLTKNCHGNLCLMLYLSVTKLKVMKNDFQMYRTLQNVFLFPYLSSLD